MPMHTLVKDIIQRVMTTGMPTGSGNYVKHNHNHNVVWSNWFVHLHYIADVLSGNLVLSIRELFAILLESSEHHSSDRIERQGKKDQRPSLSSGPTLYRGVSATRAIDPSRDPPSSIALKYRSNLILVLHVWGRTMCSHYPASGWVLTLSIITYVAPRNAKIKWNFATYVFNSVVLLIQKGLSVASYKMASSVTFHW